MRLLFLILLLPVAINGSPPDTSYRPKVMTMNRHQALYLQTFANKPTLDFSIEWPANIELTIKFCGGYTNSQDVRWKLQIGDCVVNCRAQDPFHTDQWEIIYGEYNSQLFCPSQLTIVNDHRLFDFDKTTEIGCQGKKLLYYFGLQENVQRAKIHVYDVIGIDYVDVYFYAEFGDVKLTPNHEENDYTIACPSPWIPFFNGNK